MKNKAYFILILLFFSLGGLVSFVSSTNADKCTGDNEYGVGITSLGTFKLIKDYRISLKADPKAPPSESFMVSLKSGLKYRFLPINNSENKKKMIMSVYLNQQKGMILGTSYNKAASKHYPSFDINCKTTGTFYIFFEFEGGEKGCGVGMFAVEN